MSIDIMSAVWKNGPSNSTERFVLLSIADRADDIGYCYPSYNDIAKRCAVSRPTVIKAINRMRDAGWLRTEATFKKDGSRSSNGIYVNLEMLGMGEGGSKESLPGVVKKRNPGSKESLPGVVKKRNPGSKESLPKSSYNHQSNRQVNQKHAPANLPSNLTPDEYLELTQEADEPKDAIRELEDCFTRKTALTPDRRKDKHEELWAGPLANILALSGDDVDVAKGLIVESIDKAWATVDKDGHPFIVRTPHSIVGFASNIIGPRRAAANTVTPETIWERVLAHLNANKPPDEPRLLSAVKAVGWPALMAADEYSTPRLKSQLFNAYRSAHA